MVDIFHGEDVILKINGSDVSTQLFSFEEGGGTRQTVKRKTFHRQHKTIHGTPEDWIVSMSGTTVGSDFDDIFGLTGAFDITLSWTGSRTVTYNNCESRSFNSKLDAPNRLVFDTSFVLSFYDNNGSENRVVS